MVPYQSAYFIIYIDIGHVVSEKEVGNIVSNCVECLTEFISFIVDL